MSNILYQAALWLAAGVVLVIFVTRRRKRKHM